MRYNIFLFFVLFSTNTIFSQNKLVVESKEVASSTVFKIAVELQNSDPISALQFDINYNNNEFVELDDHALDELRAEDHQVSFGNPSENVLRVVIFSMNNATLNQNSGALVNLEFKSKTNPGSYDFELYNIRASSPGGEEVNVTSENGILTVLGAKMEIPDTLVDFGNVLLGESNFRNLIIENKGNQSLELNSSTNIFPFKFEDNFPIIIPANDTYSLKVELDSSVKGNVSKELIFTNNDNDIERNQQKINLLANIYTKNILRIGTASSEKDVEVEIPVYIENLEDFNGFQFDLLIPEGLEFVPNSIIKNEARFDGHEITSSLIGNKIRFISYSFENKNFVGSSGELFKFKFKPIVNNGFFDLEISNAYITNNEQENILTAIQNGIFSIKTSNLYIDVNEINFGSIPLTQIAERSFRLTNNGQASLVIDEAIFDTNKISLDVQFSLTIDVNSSKVVNLEYTPSNSGDFLSYINFKSNGLNQETIIPIKASVYSPNYLQLDDKEISMGADSDLTILLKNNDLVRALQFDVELPTGFELKIDALKTLSVIEEYKIFASKLNSNSYRIIIYSTTNNNLIEKGDNPILDFPVIVDNDLVPGNYQFNFNNVIIVDENNLDVSSLSLSSGILNVVDAIAPVIVLTGESTVDIEVGSAYTDAGATATDNYDGDITSSIVTVNPVDTDVVGQYTVTYNVSDANSNAAVAVTRTVNVVDTTVPVITLEGNTTVDIEVGSAYTDAGATATDNYDGDITSSIVTVNPVDTDVVGQYTVTYNVSDANSNAAVEVTRTVNVVSSLSLDDIAKLNLKVYPNPTQDYWKLTASEIINSIELYDSIGRKVLYLTPKSETLDINAALLANGVYILIINNKKTIRLIKH